MLSDTRQKIINNHVNITLRLTGLFSVPVSSFEACEIWEEHKIIWLPTTLTDEEYFRVLGMVGFFLSRGMDPVDRVVRAWEWAIDTSKIGKYKKFYQIIYDEICHLPSNAFLEEVKKKIYV